MANKKKEVYKPGPMTEGKRNIIQGLLQEYDIQSASDIQEALKDLLGGTIKEMMEAEMDDHLGYEKSERSDSDDARQAAKSKDFGCRSRFIFFFFTPWGTYGVFRAIILEISFFHRESAGCYVKLGRWIVL